MDLAQKYYWLLIKVLFLISFLSDSKLTEAQNYGLKFNSQNVSLDKRTELDLTPDELMKFSSEFEISFDYKTTRIAPKSNEGFFGYVFRIISEEGNNIDLLSTPTPTIGLNAVIGKSNFIQPVEYPEEAINNWIRLRVKFMLEDDRLVIYTPDSFYVLENIGFRKHQSFKIIFGASDYKHFKNTDVPSMAIKDIEIVGNGKLKYQWPLDEKDGDLAMDRISNNKAKVINPSWLMANHQNWNLNFKEELDEHVLVAPDFDQGNIYLVGPQNAYVFSVLNNEIQKIEYKEKPVFFNWNFRLIYNTLDKKIYCYMVDDGSLYSLDLKTAEWVQISPTRMSETSYRHHNSYFDEGKNCIYTFGGYGLHHYKNKIKRFDLSTNAIEDLSTNDSIFSPRYLAGLSELNDTIYILGGYGSKSGNQLINPQSYYDLFGYSLQSGQLFEKFEIPHLVDEMIVGNSFWIDKKTRNYYALVFSKIKFDNELQLICGSIDTPEAEMVGNKIPFNFLDIRSTANLFYMPTPNKLFAYTSYATDSTTQVAIYSIDNPPNKSTQESLKLNKPENFYLWLIAIVSVLIAGWILFKIRKRKENLPERKNNFSINNQTGNETYTENQETRYRIIFFGGFQVFDKNFEDITHKFSPLLKELYLLILLNTFRNNKGVSSEIITETLWFDKDEKSARNNRAVNTAKLRSILEEIGFCELSHKTGYWKINFKASELKGDYFDFLNITSSKKNLTKQKINQLIEITRKGAFLLNVHYEWLDDFKAEVSDKIIDSLVEFAKTVDSKKEADLLVHIADCIFNFDVINEEALIMKCRAQHWMGKHSHAKATYEKFFKEYKVMYGQEYDRAFVEILDIKE